MIISRTAVDYSTSKVAVYWSVYRPVLLFFWGRCKSQERISKRIRDIWIKNFCSFPQDHHKNGTKQQSTASFFHALFLYLTRRVILPFNVTSSLYATERCSTQNLNTKSRKKSPEGNQSFQRHELGLPAGTTATA